MSTSVPTPAEIIESFPELVPKITGPPTYASLKSTRDALKANAFSFATTLGGGNHGYLGLVLPFARYNAIVPPPAGQINSWEDPAFPGIHPNIPAGATAAATANIICQHTEAKRLWQEWRNIHAALKQQLISSTEPMYLRPLRHSDSGFSNVNLRDMLSYLFTAYGKITPQALADNDRTFKQDWDPNTPFETLIDQIETCQEFATDSGNPYTDQQILDNAFNLVYRGGMFFDDCKEWNKSPQAHKTWDNFKKHFLDAQTELRLQQTTAKQGGFFASQYPQQLEDATSKFCQLIEQQQDDRTALSTLTESQTALATANTQLLKALNDITAKLNSLETAVKNNKHNKPSQPRNDRKPPQPNHNYCWTHGYRVGPQHTSATCKNPKDGHQTEATRTNTMGGSAANKP